jgi:hypothetical protein
MSIVITYLAYLLVSIALTLLAGRTLARNGRLFLLDVLGTDGPAEAISNLLVVAFYLINLGFVALTMRTAGEIGSARAAIQLLAAKIGEVLLVLGALYLVDIMVLTRLRRRLRLQSPPRAAAAAAGRAAVPAGRAAGPASASASAPAPGPATTPAPARAGQPAGAGQALWRQSARKAAQ